MSFEPFDKEYEIDKSVLSEEISDFLYQSLIRWMQEVFSAHSITRSHPKLGLALDEKTFLHPLQETFRRKFPPGIVLFMHEVFRDIKLLRNILSYMLQNVASITEGQELERILQRSGSAYTVEFKKEETAQGIKTAKGEPLFKIVGMKLAYRVPTIVKNQAHEVTSTESLITEAWESHYGMKPDDEKTVTRCTDALAGLFRDKYFPTEKRPQLGTLLQKIRANSTNYPLPADALYDNDKFLEIMKDFSKIRGNHKTGTGRTPTHEEAGFVLHYTIMLFQLLRNK